MENGGTEETQADVAAQRLVRDIRTGVLAPGHKLKIAELRTRYGIGASPLREALSLVTSLGYVTSESHRGYRVAPLTESDLADITQAREILEAGMLRESMLGHDDDWAVGIVSAAERLRRLTAKCADGQINGDQQVEATHKQLHKALIAGCKSPRLIALQDLLFDQACRYRDIMIGRVRSAGHFFETHRELVDLVLGDDVDKAAAALCGHLRITLLDVYPARNRER